MTDHARSRTPRRDVAPVGLDVWCAGNPEADAGIERSRARVAELEATRHGR